MLRFLADESCDFAAVRALRTEGFDVLSVAEASAGADDERVIALALDDRRILVTEDKDFGRLGFAAGSKSLGVVLIGFPASARSAVGGSDHRARAQARGPAHWQLRRAPARAHP